MAGFDPKDILARTRAAEGWISALRENIHREPERGNQEFRTAEKIEKALDELHIPHRRLLDTAVIGRLEGGQSGPCVALRADMDALPLTEQTGAPFASRTPGIMHACGHDVHLASALGAARLLSEKKSDLRGSVVFLFQPDEEMNGGAQRLIEKGALEGVDAIFGAHVAPDLPEGHVGVRDGKFYAASDVFDITVTGRTAHGAHREKGIDALLSACEIVPRLIALPARLQGEKSVVSVGQIQSGTAVNIVPDKASIRGILRTLGPDSRANMRQWLRETAEETARERGARADVHIHEGYFGIVNDHNMTMLAREALIALLGEGRVTDILEPTMISEDFGYYEEVCPGSFYHIGAGCQLPLHSSSFLPTNEALLTAAAAHTAVIMAALERLR